MSTCNEMIQKVEDMDLNQKTKDGIKKVFNIIACFNAHEKLYMQQKNKSKRG